jgi:3-methyladenine DNA glycosylase AlkC
MKAQASGLSSPKCYRIRTVNCITRYKSPKLINQLMSMETSNEPAPEAFALKEMFDTARFRQIAADVTAVYPDFDSEKFLALSLPELESRALMQRLRLMTESLHQTLPSDYDKALAILRKLAPRIGHSFVSLILPEYVSLYGLENFTTSLAALRFFTAFGSSEFAVRHFLRHDLKRTLAVMEIWSHDTNEHVRRLASEGSRPRLPWSFRLDELITDPSPVITILENLKGDPSLYVRKSVANHLNDITKDHPNWVLDRVEGWPLDDAHTAWIVKRALRTLIKKGDTRALAVIGAGEKAEVNVREFVVQPQELRLGDRLSLSLTLESTSPKTQRLVVDYAVHYVKKSGGTSAKVFKWKELSLDPGTSVTLTRSQSIRDFTTRIHHPGRHVVETMVNGESLAKSHFDLAR